jgi:hypothetical protein
MGRKSRDKGYAGEVEVATIFRETGHKVQQLQRNRSDLADMLVDGWLYVDSKRAERLKYPQWKRGVVAVTPDMATPALAYRANGDDWWIMMPLRDFAETCA